MILQPMPYPGGVAPVPTYGVRTSSFSYSSGDASVPAASTTLTGDLQICYTETSTAITTPPSGWTEATGSPVSGTGTFLGIFFRIAPTDGDVAGNRCNITKASYGDHLIPGMMWVRGSTGVVHVSNTGVGSLATNNLPSITTTVNNALVLFFASHGVDTASARFSWSADASLTSGAEGSDTSSTTADGGGVAVYAATKATAGSIGTNTVTQPGATSTPMMTLAFIG